MIDATAQLLTHLREAFLQNSPGKKLHPFREKGWERFEEMGLPTKKIEAFQYVGWKDLLQAEFAFPQELFAASLIQEVVQEAILPECRHSHLVFIDGKFSQEQSDLSLFKEEPLLLSLDEAMTSHSSFLQRDLLLLLKEEKDPFALLNLAVHSEGAFLYLPPSLSLSAPLQILFLSTSEVPTLLSPRLKVVVGRGAKAQFLVTQHDRFPHAPHLFLPSIDLSLEEGSHLDLISTLDPLPSAWHLQTVRASLKKAAHLRTFSFHQGAKVGRQSYHIQLQAEEAQVSLKGLSPLSKGLSSHTHALVEHAAPHTSSTQLFKCVLKGGSQSSFEGKIFVHPVAQKTEAYQLSKSLLLAPGAVANSKPNLEIFADDVKASHGACVSQIDPHQLFYLKTRGIPQARARSLLVGGFCQEMIQELPSFSSGWMKERIETFMQEEGR